MLVWDWACLVGWREGREQVSLAGVTLQGPPHPCAASPLACWTQHPWEMSQETRPQEAFTASRPSFLLWLVLQHQLYSALAPPLLHSSLWFQQTLGPMLPHRDLPGYTIRGCCAGKSEVNVAGNMSADQSAVVGAQRKVTDHCGEKEAAGAQGDVLRNRPTP